MPGRAAAPVRLYLLGPPFVTVGGRRAAFDTRKALALMAYLALGGEQSRERLALLLWPESTEQRSRSSLRRTLSVTGAALGPALVTSRAAVSLDAAKVWCDAVQFSRLAGGGLADQEAAAGLYRGEFLAGFALRDSPDFDEWQRFVADGLREQLGLVLSRLVADRLHSGAVEQGLQEARRWVAVDVLHEPAHQALISLYAAAGQRAAAIRQYRTLVTVLDRELGVGPLSETTRLYEDVLAGRGVPALAARPTAPTAEPAAAPVGLLGQADVLDRLVGAWGSTRAGGVLLTLTGASGSGKTSLADALADTAAAAGPVLRARCYEGESDLAFGTMSGLLRAALQADRRLGGSLDPTERAELARLVPSLQRGAPAAPPLDTPAAQTRLYAAAATAFRSALTASGAPGLLVVDDVHWADDASARFLSFLIRRLEDLPAGILLTWSTGQALPGGLPAAVDVARRGNRLTAVSPAPLSVDDIAALLGGGAEVRGVADWLFAETQGLPLLVTAYARAGDAGRQRGVPVEVQTLLTQRLRPCSETTTQVLAAAAVLDGPVDSDLLRATSGRSEAEVADALDQCVREGLLVPVEPAEATGGAEEAARPPSFVFPFAALPRVVYDTLGPLRRRLLHARAADAVAARAGRSGRGSAAATVAAHLARAGRGPQAAEWWWRAGLRDRELLAHAEALAHFEGARAAGYPAAPAHVAVGEVLTALGRYSDARDEFERAAALCDGDPTQLAVIEHRLAELHDRLGEWPLAEAHLASAAGLATDPVLQARVSADRGLVAYRLRDPAADQRARAAVQAARAAGDPAALAQALNVTGMLARSRGDPTAAEAALRASLAAAREVADVRPAVAALNNLARLLGETGRREEAAATAAEALVLGNSHGDRHRLAALHTNLADALHAAGRETAAMEHLKAAAALFAAVDGGAEPRPQVWTLVEW